MKIELKGNTGQDGTPTPEAPVQVQTVTGNNFIKVARKNLFDISQFPLSRGAYITNGQPVNWAGYYRINNYLKVDSNQTYTFSNSLGLPIYYGLVQYDENKEVVNYTNARTTTFTTESNTKYIRFAFQSSTEPTWIQLEIGSSATENESYQSQSYPINLGDIELCKINNYQDKIYKDNGKWYLYKEIGKRVLTSVDDGWVFGNGTTTPTPRTVIYTASYSDFNYSQKYYSNRFKYNDTSTSNRLVLESRSRIYVSLDNTLTGISTSDTNAQKLEKMKTYISNNNIDTYYVLNTPTTTEITDTRLISQLEALLGVSSYQAQTNINQENSNLASILNATALEEL